MDKTTFSTNRFFGTVARALLLSATAFVATARATEPDPETLRTNLLAVVDQMAELQPYFYDADAQAPAKFEALARARTEIETVSADQLAAFGDAVRGYPGWWQIPATMRETLEESRTRSVTRSGAVPTADNCVDSGDSCSGCPYDGGGLGAVTGLKVPELVAEGVFEIINADIGYNIPNPAKIITGVVLFVLRLSRVSVEGEYRVNKECEGNWNNHLLRTNLDATITSRASAGAIEELQAEVDRLRVDNRRRAIEANMFAFRGASSILSFILPASKGGYLEEVADIVTETIEEQKIARGVAAIRDADTLFAEAEVERAAARYRNAYNKYREAYRDAVRL